MELVGFTFIESQDEFENWQKDNPDYLVKAVAPHLMEIGMQGIEEDKYGPGMRGATKWGVFVTYIYSA